MCCLIHFNRINRLRSVVLFSCHQERRRRKPLEIVSSLPESLRLFLCFQVRVWVCLFFTYRRRHETPSNLLCYDSMHDKTCIMRHLLLSHAQSVNLHMLDMFVFISSFVKWSKPGATSCVKLYKSWNCFHVCG